MCTLLYSQTGKHARTCRRMGTKAFWKEIFRACLNDVTKNMETHTKLKVFKDPPPPPTMPIIQSVLYKISSTQTCLGQTNNSKSEINNLIMVTDFRTQRSDTDAIKPNQTHTYYYNYKRKEKYPKHTNIMHDPMCMHTQHLVSFCRCGNHLLHQPVHKYTFLHVFP